MRVCVIVYYNILSSKYSIMAECSSMMVDSTPQTRQLKDIIDSLTDLGLVLIHGPGVNYLILFLLIDLVMMVPCYKRGI